MPKITRQELIERQIAEYEKACEGKDTYRHFKKLDYWTLDEGLKLLISPIEIGSRSIGITMLLFDCEFLKDNKKYQIVTRAINDSLPVDGDYKTRLSEYKKSDIEKSISNLWYYCYADLKVIPFKFLEFIKEKDLFTIDSELEFVKIKTDSGEIQYSWASENDEDLSKYSGVDRTQEKEPLTGKEKQELGRLRSEKQNMDRTVKAAIEVGQFVQQKIDKKEKIVRTDISDVVYKIDNNIPDIRINLIWKFLPNEIKNGPGRPKKKRD